MKKINMAKKRRVVYTLIGAAFAFGIWTQTFHYDKEVACTYIKENVLDKSYSCCAWYVMRAMQKGGCPMIILPAWAYKYALPIYGFDKIYEGRGKNCSSECKIQKGDIVVIPKGSYSFWGHIAMYDGHNWVSDFKQKNMSPYIKPVKYRIYRHE